MNTDEFMKDAENLISTASLYEGPRHADDQIGMAQVYALLAIANELRRMNDREDATQEHPPLPSTSLLFGNKTAVTAPLTTR